MKNSKAVGKVRIAIARLAHDMPLHAGLLSQWKVVEDNDSTNTMAIGFTDGRFTLHVNAAFVEPLSMDELGAVLSHEAGHVVFGHVFHEPRPDEHEQARIVSEETAVNDWVVGPLPGSPILTSDFPVLNLRQDTSERYEVLKGVLPDKATVYVPLDSHGLWRDVQANGDIAKMVSTLDAAAVWAELTPEQRQKTGLPQQVEQDLRDCGAIGGTTENSVLTGNASVPWQRVLRRYVGREMRRRPVFGRPPRRYPHLVGIVPGKARQAATPKVMAVIDTSGSMTPEMLADISAELNVMAKTYSVTIVECDAKIHAVYSYRPIENVRGRGGTDLRPPFEPEFLKQHKPDLVIYFTDGHGPAPDSPPPVPVVWCLTPGGSMPCTWGREIRLG